ncbi:MAG: TetR/AcrR family transcriptional regulator [Bifidobacteriaceae bacterium]|nr:TetR/AcrR family transcriptional regulator [Bifidobacteriaceae bacterium]
MNLNRDLNKHQKKSEATRQSIIRSAYEICLEKGFTHITVSDITKRANVTRSLFYHYFPNKESMAQNLSDAVSDYIFEQVKDWDMQREKNNISSALDNIISLARKLSNENSAFSDKMVQSGNGQLYVNFYDHLVTRITDYLCENTIKDFFKTHTCPINHLRTTVLIMVNGVISTLRTHPEIENSELKKVAEQILHIDESAYSLQ